MNTRLPYFLRISQTRVSRGGSLRLAVLALALAAVPAVGWSAAGASGPAVGEKAPKLDLRLWFQGGPLTLEKLKGKVVVLEFWESDCEDCRGLIPHIKRLHEAFSKKEPADAVVIGICLNGAYDDKVVKGLLKNAGITYAVAGDNDMGTFFAYLGDEAVYPTVVIIGKDGTIAYKGSDPETLARQVDAKLKDMGVLAKADLDQVPAPRPTGSEAAAEKSKKVFSALEDIRPLAVRTLEEVPELKQ